MGSLLLKGVRLDGRKSDILIEGNRIARIAETIDAPAGRVIDGSGKAVIASVKSVSSCAEKVDCMRQIGDDR